MLLLSMSIFCDEKLNSISENIQIPLISQYQTISIVIYSDLSNIKREGTRKENYNKYKNTPNNEGDIFSNL